MGVDLVIKNCSLVLPKVGVLNAGVAVEAGKIQSIATPAHLPKGDREIDATGKYLFPGVIDPHVHYGHAYEGYSQDFKEDITKETRSAAIGGVTTVNITHRISPPTKSYVDFFNEVRPVGDQNAFVDFTLSFGIMFPGHVKEMERYKEMGVASFKYFLGYKGSQASKMNMVGGDDGTLYMMFRKTAQMKCLSQVHCENAEVIDVLVSELKETGRNDPKVWPDSRPEFVEAESISKTLILSEAAGSSLYIPHVSSGQGADVVRNAKKQGKKVIAETCPHYINVQSTDPNIGVKAKVNPPVRDRANNEKLWEGIFDGTIDTIGTDHIGLKLKNKLGANDIWSAGLGFPGSATMLPLMLGEGFHKRGLSLQRIAELTSYNSAKAFGLFPRKGALQVGSDADITLVDLDKEVTIKPELLKSGAEYTIYDGWKVKGWPVMTILKGNLIVEDGEPIGVPGNGKFLSRDQAPVSWFN